VIVATCPQMRHPLASVPVLRLADTSETKSLPEVLQRGHGCVLPSHDSHRTGAGPSDHATARPGWDHESTVAATTAWPAPEASSHEVNSATVTIATAIFHDAASSDGETGKSTTAASLTDMLHMWKASVEP